MHELASIFMDQGCMAGHVKWEAYSIYNDKLLRRMFNNALWKIRIGFGNNSTNLVGGSTDKLQMSIDEPRGPMNGQNQIAIRTKLVKQLQWVNRTALVNGVTLACQPCCFSAHLR